MKNASSKITLLLLAAVAMLFAGCSPLHMAAERGDMKEVERLIAEGADVNAKGIADQTPLHSAAYRGNKEVVELLISEGADVNGFDFNSGRRPLHYAAINGHKEVAELLISKGVHVNYDDYYGWTPLHYAAYFGHKEVAELLISKGADVNVPKSYKDKSAIAMIESLAKEHETAKAKAKKAAAEEAALKAKEAAAEALKAADAAEAAFTEVARSYRAATVKPALPEDARKFKVQAEFAVGKKEFQRAADLYGAVLAGYPWWPEGHYNRALILGELSRYSDAIREMKRFLTLVPDGSYARTAQDKIYQWEGEIR